MWKGIIKTYKMKKKLKKGKYLRKKRNKYLKEKIIT